MVCANKTCESNKTRRVSIPGKKDSLGRKVTLLIDVCDNCRKQYELKEFTYRYYRCGRILFVTEISNPKEIE